jgi:hypothetical protein
MNATSAFESATAPLSPQDRLARSHASIIARLDEAVHLPELLAQANRARQLASGTLALFEGLVLPHHADEEGELFPAVLGSAANGEESEWAEDMARQLTQEHRDIESLWRRIKPALREAAHGRPAALDAGELEQLILAYTAHAMFEEQEYLARAQQIVARARNRLAAMTGSSHVRNRPPPLGYL